MAPPFQSAPAIAGGRCERTGSSRQGPHRVSIRARHCWRAMLAYSVRHPRCSTFQSAPAIAGGRCTTRAPPISCRAGFNPRPPLLAGDAASARSSPSSSPAFQSAPAIAGGRCMPACRNWVRKRWFQSAPAIAGGRCQRRLGEPYFSSLFQSAPAIAGGRCRAAFSVPASREWFQSAPAIAGGRCCSSAMHRRALARFNPRPPLLAGDAW